MFPGLVDGGVGGDLLEDGRDVDVGFAEDAVAELGEHPVGRDVLAQFHDEPALHEYVDARGEPAAAGDELAPVVAVEVTPVLGVEGVDVEFLRGGDLEEEVLDEVCGEQWCTAMVERFEDDLGVVAGFEVDDDELELFAQGVGECGEALPVAVGFSSTPAQSSTAYLK